MSNRKPSKMQNHASLLGFFAFYAVAVSPQFRSKIVLGTCSGVFAVGCYHESPKSVPSWLISPESDLSISQVEIKFTPGVPEGTLRSIVTKVPSKTVIVEAADDYLIELKPGLDNPTVLQLVREIEKDPAVQSVHYFFSPALQ